MVDSDNKYCYWVFTINPTKEGKTLPGEQTMCQFLTRYTEKYYFQLERVTSLHYQGCCKTTIRKRQQTVLKEFSTDLNIHPSMITIASMRGTWEQAKAYCTKADSSLGPVFTNEVLYSGQDIEMLDSQNGRYPWQDKIIKKIIDEDTPGIKAADDRSIIWVEDTQGGNGKSKLVKWCCARHNDIVKISFGTSNQLRSAIIAAGRRRVYFIDVPRTLGTDDSLASLMSALEDLKNGFVVSAMYGKNQSLMIDPPHIIVFSNDKCPKHMLSEDRWKVYVINYEKDLIKQEGEFYYPCE